MKSYASMLAILLFAFVLRAAPLTQNRFHPDEAWYAHFALRIISGRDPWLHDVIVDKPPLPFYLAAGSLAMLGPSPRENAVAAEMGLRVPALAASLMTVALVYRLGRALYGERAGLVAALVNALSPLAILFAVTLFTDAMLTAFLVASLWAAARRRWGWSGLGFALAFASKQTALFFAPLILIVGYLRLVAHARSPKWRGTAAGLLRWLLPVVMVIAAIVLWDRLRAPEIGFWAQGYADNNPRRFIRASEVAARFGELVRLLHFTTGSAMANLLLLGGCLTLAGRALRQRGHSVRALFDLILIGFSLAYLSVYWLLAFNLWDRYLVALLPVLALLAGRAISVGSDRFAIDSEQSAVLHKQDAARHPIVHWTLNTVHWLLPLALLTIPALQAARSQYPIGGDHGAYDGIAEVSARINALPVGTVLYDHWLSWPLSFYTFDGPAYVAWVSGPDALAEDLCAHGDSATRYFIAPAWESFTEMNAAIDAAGFEASPILSTRNRTGQDTLVLYEIRPAR